MILKKRKEYYTSRYSYANTIQTSLERETFGN